MRFRRSTASPKHSAAARPGPARPRNAARPAAKAPDKREAWMAPALDALLRARRGPLVDVGANTGHTLKKLFSVQPDRAYWGFEPQPEAVARLLEFATEKSLRDC